jgi:hypothetical protein
MRATMQHARSRVRGWTATVTAAVMLPLVGLFATATANAATTTCGWPVKADSDVVNIAWPDQSAEYWAAPFYAAPGSAMTIRAQFPLARYMSFHLYEGSMPVDAVSDHQLQPATGANPYLPGAPRVMGGSYVLHVVYGQRPQNPAPNTLYAASLNGEPNVSGLILYRLYLPQLDATGGVPLPQIDYTSATGPSPAPCPDTSAVDNGAVNQLIRDSSLPTEWPSQLPTTSAAPSWGLSRSGASATTAGPASVRTGNPFFANFDNVYLSLTAFRDRGAVVAFRAKAPTFANTSLARVMPSAQVRYWSICSNDFPTTRYVACLPDQSVRLDRQGFFNFVISDPAHRPNNLTHTDNWLPAGPYADTFVLYRQMLPDPSFGQAIAFAPNAAGAAQTMGAYYPDTRVCSVAAFERNRCGLPTATRGAASKR